MLKTTTDNLYSYNIIEYYGIIYEYQDFSKENLEITLKKLELKAHEMGANAIIGIKFEPYIKSEILRAASYSAGRVVYGTAVKIENNHNELNKFKKMYDDGILTEDELNILKNH